MAILKKAASSLFSFYRTEMKIRSYAFIHLSTSNPSRLLSAFPNAANRSPEKKNKNSNSLLCDFHGSLLRSTSPFPFFAAVAFEGVSILRSILLLLSFPLVLLLGQNSEAGLKVMVFVAFGLRTKDMGVVARAVLPKVYLEDLHRHGYEVLQRAQGRKVVVTSLPRVMVEGFLEEYLGVNEVVAPEIGVVRGKYFTGRVIAFGGAEGRMMALEDLIKEEKVDIGLVSSSSPVDQLLIPCCKDIYVVTMEGNGPCTGSTMKTTCFSYLLRFSPLFEEIASDIQPVAMDAHDASMFYGTTAGGFKFLDPIFFFMNPRPRYHVTFLRVPPEMTVSGGWPAADAANWIQRELTETLEFKCTTLTRKDKYLMLVGNNGTVEKKH